ncbi:hypothetical protein CWM41_28690, partial [Escherichia coli]|uniref:hypothetical protein n=1 Tax=Escherichia coli TaxID=562 RepID=UPI000CB2D25D
LRSLSVLQTLISAIDLIGEVLSSIRIQYHSQPDAFDRPARPINLFIPAPQPRLTKSFSDLISSPAAHIESLSDEKRRRHVLY